MKAAQDEPRCMATHCPARKNEGATESRRPNISPPARLSEQLHLPFSQHPFLPQGREEETTYCCPQRKYQNSEDLLLPVYITMKTNRNSPNRSRT